MVATFKIGFYDPYTGIWVEGEKEFFVDGVVRHDEHQNPLEESPYRKIRRRC